MKCLLPVFFLAFFFASCSPDNPRTVQDSVDTPKVAVVDTPLIIVDTVRGEDGTPIIVRHDCSILRKKIPADSALEELEYDLTELSFCVDSFDFVYVVPNLLASWLSEERVKGTQGLTYNDFMIHMKEFKTTSAYAELYRQATTLDSVRSLPFDASRIQSMQVTFGKLGMTAYEWNALSGFARTYPLPDKSKKIFTWGDMLDAFDLYFSQMQQQQQQ